LKDWSFHKRGTEVLQGILLYVRKSTTQLEPIARSLLEIMEYPDRCARSQCLKEEMLAHDLYSLVHLPEEMKTWELLLRDLAGASESEIDSDDSDYAGDSGSDVQDC
jgi:hypothetical protein